MKIITITRKVAAMLITALLSLNAIAQDNDKNKSNVLEMTPMQTGLFELPPRLSGPYKTVETACHQYAKDSTLHNKWQIKQHCGYKGAEWNSNFQYHYIRCVKNEVSPNEFKARQEAIAKCICEPYADSAVKQNEDKLALGCKGLKPPVWSSDPTGHYNWCARGGGNIIKLGSFDKIKSDRDRELEKCKKPFTPVNLKVNNGLTVVGRTPTLTWIDPGAGKVQAANQYQLEVLVNGSILGVPLVSVPSYTVPAGALPYSALVKWKVKGRNKFGDSSWSSTASFRIKGAPTPPPPQKEKTTTVYGYKKVPYTGIIYYLATLSIPKATALSISNPNLGLGKQWIVQIIPNGVSSQDCGTPGKTINIPPGFSSTKIKGTSLYKFMVGFCLTTTDKSTLNQGLPQRWALKIKYKKN